MNTVIKVVLSFVVFIVCSAIIRVMMNAHIFGKFIIVAVCVFIIRLIWSSGSSKQVQQNQTQQISSQTPVSQAQHQANANTTKASNNSGIQYSGGHNGEQNQSSSIPLSSQQQAPPSNSKNKEFGGTNPYAKN